MVPATRVTYGRLASLLAEKRTVPYHEVISWLRCLLNFSLLRSTVMCFQGLRTTTNGPGRLVVHDNQLDLAACMHMDVGSSCQMTLSSNMNMPANCMNLFMHHEFI